ncbi:MAG: hypothetical protein JWP35_2995 [Caulobacter sp.]|nr:hypothetical protein [Caulobacter sp.]
MRWMAMAGVALALAGGVGAAYAQNEVNEVVVTGSRLSEFDAGTTPSVALRKRADNVITTVTVICDTRDPEQRKSELKTTLRALIKGAPAAGVELGVEGDDLIGRFDETNLDGAIVGGGKPDTSAVTLVLKTKIRPEDSFDSATGRITGFIKKTPKTGRTEILGASSWDLTLINPQQYRPTVIGLIAADANKAAGEFGPEYGVSVDGLQQPLSWYQSAPLELALYIPYRMNVSHLRK